MTERGRREIQCPIRNYVFHGGDWVFCPFCGLKIEKGEQK